VTLDLAGHGDSGKDRSRWSILGLAQDVVAVADDLRLRRIIFVGHSMGGWISLESARVLRGRVVGVVLVDIVHDVGERRSVAQAFRACGCANTRNQCAAAALSSHEHQRKQEVRQL
jgi:pimeloyl-ACP methyl ester carboxylesterase